MTGPGPWRHDRGMNLPAPLAWLVDEAGAPPLAVPHPIITRRTWLWRAETGAVIEALGFAGGPLSQAGHDWLAELGPVQQDTVGPAPEGPVLGWAGTRPFGPA